MRVYLMQRLIYKSIIVSLLLLAGFTSCDYAKRMKWEEKEISTTVISNDYFNNAQIDYVYKAKIKVLDNDFGGIVIVKKMDSITHRVVFTTEFGNTIFDFTITPTSYKLNSALAQINKKIIIKMLALDFQNLVSSNYEVTKSYANENGLVSKSKVGKRQNYYFYPKNQESLAHITTTKRGKEKTIIRFMNIMYGIAHKVEIEHQNIEMNMDLTFIGNAPQE